MIVVKVEAAISGVNPVREAVDLPRHRGADASAPRTLLCELIPILLLLVTLSQKI